MNADGSVYPTNDMSRWASFFESGNRLIAYTGNDNIHISTAFLGMDHNHFGEGAPILFETMIFGGRWDSFQSRFSTYAEALEGHKMACMLAFEREVIK
jgi:hypothetical protein